MTRTQAVAVGCAALLVVSLWYSLAPFAALSAFLLGVVGTVEVVYGGEW
jgi:hypothetical protein